MRRLTHTLTQMKRRAPGAALLMVYLYLGYHAFSGSQGLVRWLEQTDRADYLEARLDRLEAQRDGLQQDVDMLSARSLDLDTLDVEARRMLFVAHPDEVTVWLTP
jgi:cell division protein FtsB